MKNVTHLILKLLHLSVIIICKNFEVLDQIIIVFNTAVNPYCNNNQCTLKKQANKIN